MPFLTIDELINGLRSVLCMDEHLSEQCGCLGCNEIGDLVQEFGRQGLQHLYNVVTSDEKERQKAQIHKLNQKVADLTLKNTHLADQLDAKQRDAKPNLTLHLPPDDDDDDDEPAPEPAPV